MTNPTLNRRGFLTGVGAAGLGAIAIGPGTVAAETGRHIVGTSTPGATAAAQRAATAVHRVLDFGAIGGAVAGQFTAEALDGLRRNPNVRYVEVDGTMWAVGQTLPWGVDRIDAEVAHANGDVGGLVDIAIVDSGIDDDHPDLQANIGSGKAFVNCHGTNCNDAWSDDNDHGTHCAGIADAVDNAQGVVGVSTGATLHAVKVLNRHGSGNWSDVAAGITYVADQGWDVANMSLGGGRSQAVADAVQYAYGKGVLLVAAAGNNGPCTDCVIYPAAEPEVIAVSATGQGDCLAAFSSQGPQVELAGPGVSIESTVIGGYASFSGTSMASPHVAGTGALLMANGYTNVDARARLSATAEDVGLAENEQGSGLVDAAAALGLDSSDSTGTCSGSGSGSGSGGGSGGDNPPTAAIDGVVEHETPSPHASFDVSWSAADVDGDLATAQLALTDVTDGELEVTASGSLSGGSASGTTTLQAKHDDGTGNQYQVVLTVTDANGNQATDSTTFTENGV